MSPIEKEMRSRLFEVPYDQIVTFSKMEQGGEISNLLTGLEDTVYSLFLKDDDYNEGKLRFNLFFSGLRNNVVEGYILENIDVFEKDRNELTLWFSIFLESHFSSVDRIDVYNTFQSQLRSLLEKLDFFTYTQNLIEKINGKNPSLILKSKRGAVFVPMINKIEAYKSLFERELHKVYKKKRMRGEWFQLTTTDYIEICKYMIDYQLEI